MMSGTGTPMKREDSDLSREVETLQIGAQTSVDYAIQLDHSEKLKMETYFLKFIDKLFGIYNKLNVKVVSLEVLRQELSPLGDKSLIQLLDRLSGNLNKVSNHVSLCLKESDNETVMYKNIIANKLKPRINSLEDEVKKQGELKSEVKFLNERIEHLQAQLENSLKKEDRYLK